MKEIFRQNQFKKDVKKIRKSGRYQLKYLFEVIELLEKRRGDRRQKEHRSE